MAVERRLVTLTADDGEIHDALVEIDERALRVRERLTGRRTAVLHCHGVMGNFLVGTLRFLPGPLARAGFPVLVLETRMSNVGQLFGQAILPDAMLDIDAGVRYLAEEGFDSLILSGYSSGAVIAIRYAALRHLPQLRGLIGIGTPWGLPQSMENRSVKYGSDPLYDDIVFRIRRAIGGDPRDPANDRLFVIERSRGPTRQPQDSEVYTFRTWWESRGPSALSAMTFRQIGSIWAPILLVQGDDDEIVEMEETEALKAVAERAGNPDVEIAVVPGARHEFKGKEILTLDAIIPWLRRKA